MSVDTTEHPPEIAELIEKYRELHALHHEFVQATIAARQACQANKFDMARLVDISFLCKETIKLTESIEKDARTLMRLTDPMVCQLYVTQYAGDAEAPSTVQGFIGQGSPEPGLGANVPARGTKEYNDLCLAAGATPEQLEADLVRPHWPHLTDWISRRAAEGLPPPPGIDPSATYPLWHLRNLRPRKGVNLV